MSDDEFASLCAEQPDLFFEMTAEGQITVTPPNFSATGARNSRIQRQVEAWAERDGRGVAFDSSAGFVLPNGARRSPDSSWVSDDKIEDLEGDEGYLHLCPDFVIELRSKTDRIRILREKMQEWIANGAKLAWLIDPQSRTVEVYRPACTPEVLENPASVAGEGPVDGLVLDLTRIWDLTRKR